jgi:5'-3' exonuclease
MGIKHLNQFIRKECSDAVKTMQLNELSGKTVVVDASIFMYRFIADGALLENMYSMMSFFQMHGIVALFVFDGKPPEEKRKTLNKRRRLKHIAEMQYNRYVRDLNNRDEIGDATKPTKPNKPTSPRSKCMRSKCFADDSYESVTPILNG